MITNHKREEEIKVIDFVEIIEIILEVGIADEVVIDQMIEMIKLIKIINLVMMHGLLH